MVTDALDSPADRYLDRIVSDVLAGNPGRPAHIRLLVAADLAELLERAA